MMYYIIKYCIHLFLFLDTYERGIEKLNQIVQYNLSSITTDEDNTSRKKTRQIRAKKSTDEYILLSDSKGMF